VVAFPSFRGDKRCDRSLFSTSLRTEGALSPLPLPPGRLFGDSVGKGVEAAVGGADRRKRAGTGGRRRRKRRDGALLDRLMVRCAFSFFSLSGTREFVPRCSESDGAFLAGGLTSEEGSPEVLHDRGRLGVGGCCEVEDSLGRDLLA
jgi:hypothetical protein